MLEYKGYIGCAKFNIQEEIFHREVANIKDVVTFQAKSVDTLRKAFVDSINDYIEFCEKNGEEPEKPCKK